MTPDATDLIFSFLATGGVVALLAVVLGVVCVALQLWIVYTVIWRAVRRGLREFHYPDVHGDQAQKRSVTPRATPSQSWSISGDS